MLDEGSVGVPLDYEDPLADERIQFYLAHRAAIREWAAIEKDVFDATHRLMVGLGPDLEEAVAQIDENAQVVGDSLSTSWPRLAVVRPEWPKSPNGDALVGVTLEWRPQADPSGGNVPYYGIRVDVSIPQGAALRQVMRPLADASHEAIAAGLRINPDSWWVLKQRIPRTDDWWQRLDAWRSDIVGRMVVAWQVGAPLVDAGLRAVPAR